MEKIDRTWITVSIVWLILMRWSFVLITWKVNSWRLTMILIAVTSRRVYKDKPSCVILHISPIVVVKNTGWVVVNISLSRKCLINNNAKFKIVFLQLFITREVQFIFEIVRILESSKFGDLHIWIRATLFISIAYGCDEWKK